MGGGRKERKVHWVRKEILLRKKDKGGLGFRCFESMNKAMLMKQLWRTSTPPDLQLSKVLKNKYFQNGDLRSCKPKSSDSVIWKSLCGVRNMFLIGASNYSDPDAIRWNQSSSGIYSVRSGYDVAFNWKMAEDDNVGESSNTEESSLACTRFWKLRVPGRIKLVTWKLFYNCLLVGWNLRKRGCDSNVECQFCGFKDECTRHVFLECWWASSFWKELGVAIWTGADTDSVRSWLWFLFRQNDVAMLRKVVIGIWVLHDKSISTISHCCSKVHHLCIQFDRKALVGWGGDLHLSEFSTCPFRIFCDGSWLSRSKSGGFGVVVWESDSSMECAAGCWSDCGSGFEAEIYAIVEGLKIAESHQASDARIFSDSVEAIWALQSGLGYSDDVSMLIKQAVSLMARNPG